MTAAASTSSTYHERTLEVAGRKVRLLQGGEGAPLLVLHHSTGNPGWLPFHERLGAHFTVYAPDLPGYGQSERAEWARDARDLAILCGRLADRLGLTRFALLGLGFGGMIAAELAVMEPGRLSTLTLVGAAGLQPEEGEILDQMLVDFKDYVAAGFRDEESYHRVLGEDPGHAFRELWDYSREMTARLTWKPYMFDRRLAPLLSEVRVPALLIWGSEDRIVPPVCAEQYERALPQARRELIAGAGHLVELEEPERVAALIARHAAVDAA